MKISIGPSHNMLRDQRSSHKNTVVTVIDLTEDDAMLL